MDPGDAASTRAPSTGAHAHATPGSVRRATARAALSFTAAERLRLAGLYGFIALLHVVGWGLFLYYASRYASLVGLGAVAYLFGLRHAFDADHIAAVDDTVRFLLQEDRRPLGVGFFFSLGHSTIVAGLAVAILFAATAVKRDLPAMQNLGGLIGAGVSGGFLWFIGILNLLVLLDILKVWKGTRAGHHTHDHVEELLARRGFLNRLFGQRLQGVIRKSWHMYPVGLLFGLGFDTASEVGLLAMTAGASTSDLPWPAVLSLPVLFAAGMSVMDTTDGILMCKAYDWAFVNPLRKIYYNLTTTSLSILVALVIGTVELAQVLVGMTGASGPVADFLAGLDFGSLGYLVVGLFLLAWAISVAIWKFGRFEERYGTSPVAHAHEHTHESGLTHTHRHFH
jgi:nickel/cobalt transporter (NiCoT) family protein